MNPTRSGEAALFLKRPSGKAESSVPPGTKKRQSGKETQGLYQKAVSVARPRVLAPSLHICMGVQEPV